MKIQGTCTFLPSVAMMGFVIQLASMRSPASDIQKGSHRYYVYVGVKCSYLVEHFQTVNQLSLTSFILICFKSLVSILAFMVIIFCFIGSFVTW